MKLATWNVNSLKVRLPQVLEFLAVQKPDALCLQETKSEDANFPIADITGAGYQAVFSGQKTYNGVAILSPHSPQEVTLGIAQFEDPQKRVIAAVLNGVRVICVYIPNGESVESDKYRYKLDWLRRLNACLKEELAKYPRLALLGDYNIAPENRDVHDPKFWEGKVLFSEPEKAAFRDIVALGLQDSFRLFEQPEKSFSWWDYRMNGFKRNLGLRIDHILLSAELAKVCKSCVIDREMRAKERPSDHAPVLAEIDV
ncbi:MAG TPA: exodeoxyribonuclease III [Candidatus Binatia bacterium]|jgi:exodeoxyribonuclease-3|nr:exodeoxyribonuclease III [Candidatus Binatia bacterium]